MSLQQRHVYSGVQVIPSVTEEDKIAGVLSTGVVDSKTATVLVNLSIQFGLDSAEELHLRKLRSVFVSGSRLHLTGLTEYFFCVPAELATLCGFNSEAYGVIESAITASSDRRKIKSYYLRPFNPNRKGIQVGSHKAIKLWSHIEEPGQVFVRYPEIQDAAVTLTLDFRLNQIYSGITDEDYL